MYTKPIVFVNQSYLSEIDFFQLNFAANYQLAKETFTNEKVPTLT